MQGYRTHTTYTGSLGHNSVRYFTSRIVCVSLKGFSGIDVILGNCTKPSRKINHHLVIDLKAQKHLGGIKGYNYITSAWYLNGITSRARSLRNLLVSGNECGRVFPAGVGPGSPSRDAANWLPSRFSLSVETRRRYGWLRMMVFPGARLFPSPNLVPFGRVAARERQGALSRRAW